MAGNHRSSQRLNGDAAAFYAQIFAAAKAGCCRELRQVGCTEEEAEELFMATCEKVMRTVDPISGKFSPGQMVVFLKVSCRRRLIDERRHRRLVAQVHFDSVETIPDSTAGGPEELAEDHETAEVVLNAINALPPLDRLVFRSRHQLGMSPREICRTVRGLSSRRYRRAIQRANAQVRRSLDQHA
ncbi:MAG: RNA polymerase sigma factor [Solirubrobacterales bacterium]